MAALRMPVATMNAITQIIVPPPKFFIEELLPQAEVKSSLKLTHMIVIERGESPAATPVEPRVGIVLGSGLGPALGDNLVQDASFAFEVRAANR